MTNDKRIKKKNFIMQNAPVSIGAILLLLLEIIRRIWTTNLVSDVGNAVYATVIEFYFVIYSILGIGIPCIIEKLVSNRISKGQYKNSERLLYSGFLFAGLFGIVSMVCYFAMLPYMIEKIMLFSYAKLAIFCMLPAILFSGFAGCIEGYLLGLNKKSPVAISYVVKGVSFLLFSIISISLLSGHGAKIGSFLLNDNYKYYYGVAGVFIGLTISTIFQLLFLSFVAFMLKRAMYSQISHDPTRIFEHFKEQIAFILRGMGCFVSLALFDAVLTLVFQGIFYRTFMEQSGIYICNLYYGVFYGKYKFIVYSVIAFAMISFPYVQNFLRFHYKKEDYYQVRQKIGQHTKFCVIFVMPLITSLLSLSKPISGLLFYGEINMLSKMLVLGSVTILFLIVALNYRNSLIAMGKEKLVWLYTIIVSIIQIIAVIISFSFTDAHIYGIVYGMLGASVLLCIIFMFTLSRIVNYRQELFKTFLFPIASSLIAGGIGYMLFQLFSSLVTTELACIISCIVEWVLFYLVVIAFGSLKKEDLTMFPFSGILISFGTLIRRI